MQKSWAQGFKTLLNFVLGFLVGALIVVIFCYGQSIVQQSCIKKYSLTSSTLDCTRFEDTAARLHSIDQAIDQAVALDIKSGKATRISVWVRDQESRQWAASNENDRYAPASLLKLPLMIAYYKLAEIQPTLLDSPLVYTRSSELNDDSQDFAPAKTLVEGQSYTVEQLIENMIIYSDNNATALLVNHIDPSIFNNTLIDLGIKIPSTNNMNGGYDFVTTKTYANIFRTLYNASYLNRDLSEQALEIMASSTFKGIADPLPAGTVVAHKFGEREVDNLDGTLQKRELHDCGLIYKGEHPYSLCVMTEGQDFNQLLLIIKDMSAIVYSKI